MRKIVIAAVLIFCPMFALAQNNSGGNNPEPVPFSNLFYKFGPNVLHSFTYNYGLNYLLGSLGTYFMVTGGADWAWSNIAYNNRALAYSGTPFGALGFVLPVVLPLGMYFYGGSAEKPGLQITGLALGQAAILGVLISSSMKAFTSRRDPGILEGVVNGTREAEDFSNDFAFGFLERGVFSGWPSSHTMVMFAMAVTLTELYPDSLPVKITAYTYAFLTGIGMSVFGHWASDTVAGALIGYSIGKSVGSSYKELLDKNSGRTGGSLAAAPGKNNLPGFNMTNNLSFYILPNTVGINIRY